MRTNRPAIQRASALALGAFVFALSLAFSWSTSDVSAGHLGRCANFTIGSTQLNSDGAFHPYTDGSGFSVDVRVARTIDVQFKNATRLVAHLILVDNPQLAPVDYAYKSPGVTQDLTEPGRRAHGSAITSVRFCFIPPATPTPSPTPTPTQKPTPTPTLRPTATPTLKPTASPTQKPTPKPPPTPTDRPTATPTQPPTQPPTASPSPTPTPVPSSSAPGSESPSATPQSTPSAGATPALVPTDTPPPAPSAAPTEVVTPSPSPTATPAEALTPPAEPGGAIGGGGPSSFVTSIPTPDKLGSDATVIGQSLLLAILFLLLAAFPAQLFNKTLEENYLEVSGWFAVGGRWTAPIREGLAAFWRRRSGLIVFLVISASLYGFLSPEFGPTIESAASLLGILGGLAIVITAFEIPLVYFYRAKLKDRGRLAVQPLTIFVGVACVVISRIADFQPGYLYGLVVGYVYAKELPIRDEGRANALTAIWMLTVSLAAFFSLPILESASAATPLLQIALAAGAATIFIGGLEGLLFELVPLRFLRGETVWAWHRAAWAILFLAAAFTFVHILLTPTSGYLGSTRTSPLLAAVILFFSFGVFSVAFWGYFRYRPAKLGGPSAPAS